MTPYNPIQFPGFPNPNTPLIYGGDYNPDQWPKDIWLEDAKLMREVGVNLVSLAIFSWAKLEPRPGDYNFGWLDEVINLLHQHGVFVNLATATASPPAWLSRKYPESLPVDANGMRFKHGSRQHYCPNSTAYVSHGTQLVTALAARYAKHPAVVMWHINNEYGCHVSECYCEVCEARFREWLKTRYASLDELNEAWGTAFWSQAYTEWDEIGLPNRVTTFRNPGQTLDYKRFMNHSLLNLYKAEVAALRAAGATQPVTTNFVFGIKALDGFEWAKHEDITAVDLYPDPAEPALAWRQSAFCMDLTRSYKNGNPFILMEQTTTQVNWRTVNQLKPPGMMRAFNMQALARGADGLMFFQWRASRNGAEKFHAGMVQHYGAEGRVFAEVKQLGQELKQLQAIVGSRVPAQVAILISHENMWALELDSKPGAMDGWEAPGYWHAALTSQNIAVDLVHPDGDLSQYKLVIAPVLYQLTRPQADALTAFVSNGGTLVTTYFTGIVDAREHIWLGGYPALLQDVLGIKVEEWQPMLPAQHNALDVAGESAPVTCTQWADLLHTTSAEAIATYRSEFYAGRPAITYNTYGKGEAYYFGTRPEQPFLVRWLLGLCDGLGVRAPARADAGVEASLRSKDGQDYLFLINQNAVGAAADLGARRGTDMLTGKAIAGKVALEGFGVRVIILNVP
jgi:beta-galactosidase